MSIVSDCMNTTHSTEKGVCILGESCPYDHGADPLVIGGNEMTQFPGPPGILPPHGMPLPPNATKSGEPLCCSHAARSYSTMVRCATIAPLILMSHCCTCTCTCTSVDMIISPLLSGRPRKHHDVTI